MGSENVKVFTDRSFEQDIRGSALPVLVDFHAVWCGPCKRIAPMIDAVADAYAGRLKVGKIDVDAEPITTMQLGVTSMPTLLLFAGGVVVWKQVGVPSKSQLEAALSAHVAPAIG